MQVIGKIKSLFKPKKYNKVTIKLKNKFIVIIPVYNARDLIIDCITSLTNQSFDDLGIIIRDDISTDGTDSIIRNFLNIEGNSSFTKFNNKDILFIRNDEKLYPVGNTYESVINNVENDNAIIGVVDGDDRLFSNEAVSKIFNLYEEKDKWMIWSQHINSTKGQSKPLPKDEVIYNNRNYWSVTHFRTSKAFLFNKLSKDDIMDPFKKDSYFRFSGDAAFLFPFIEMCGNEKSYFNDEILYYYNNNLSTNEHNKNLKKALKYGDYIRKFSKKYKKLYAV